MVSQWAGPKQKPYSRLSIMAHLKELRKRLLVAGVFFLAMCAVGIAFSRYIFDFLLEIAPGYDFIYATPSQLIIQYLKVGMLVGLVLALPVIFYELWRFLCPGLKPREEKIILVALTFGVLLFAAGVFFAYQVITPFTLDYLLNANTNSRISPVITIDSYISFITTLFLIFGVIFEMPIMLIALTQAGIIQPQTLVKGQKYMVLVIFILAAAITPPDVVSQIIVAIPLLLLFELSLIACIGLKRLQSHGKT